MDEITKMELNLINAVREATDKLRRELEYNQFIGGAQLGVLVLILWRLWNGDAS